MKIFIVVDETPFYHPDFVAEFLHATPDDIVGAALVTQVPRKNNIESYFHRNWWRLTPREILTLAIRKYRYRLLDHVKWGESRGRYYSVRSALKDFDVPHFEVRGSINAPSCLERIAQVAPEVIVSSGSLIFGEALLSIPTKCAINRHSALLPANGGLLPVFQAYRKGELETGVTVHTMVRAIDRGIPLAQARIPIRNGDSLSNLYKSCFAESADVLLHAIEKIRRDDYSPVENGLEPSYYSFPSPEHWVEFRTRGGKFI